MRVVPERDPGPDRAPPDDSKYLLQWTALRSIMLVSILNRLSCSYNNRRSHSGTYSSRSRSRSHSRSPSPRRHANHGPPSPLLPHLKSKQRPDDLHQHSRHGHKRKRSRSRSRSTSKPRERERERDRDRGSSDLAKKHKLERSSGGHHRDRQERSRSYERSHKSKPHSSSHSSHSRHRRWVFSCYVTSVWLSLCLI